MATQRDLRPVYQAKVNARVQHAELDRHGFKFRIDGISPKPQ